MSNQKFLNKVKEFAQELDHQYDIEKFKLKESYATSLLITANIGGSSGGSCWGNHSCEYDVSDNEIIDRVASSIGYTMMNYFSDYIMVEYNMVIKKHLSNLSSYDYITYVSNGGDYYGNYDKEGIYEFPIYPLVKLLLDDEHYQIFKSYLSNQKKKIEEIFIDRKTAEKIEEINKKIETFESDKAKELANIKETIQRYESQLKILKEEANKFATKKTESLKKLKEELKQLQH